jgi:hypothetical protein
VILFINSKKGALSLYLYLFKNQILYKLDSYLPRKIEANFHHLLTNQREVHIMRLKSFNVLLVISLLTFFSMCMHAKATNLNNWKSVSPPAVSDNWELQGVSFPTENEGWAVGYDGMNFKSVILHYSGGTWVNVTSPSPSGEYLNDVSFPTENKGWAVGYVDTGMNYEGAIFYYSGGTWVNTPPSSVMSSWWLISVSFPTENKGWAVGFGYDGMDYKGIIRRYLGGTWFNDTPPAVSNDYWYLMGVSFPTEDKGWAVGYEYDGVNYKGVILRYSGSTWFNDTPPAVSGSWWLWDVSFPTENEGWAVGYDWVNNKGVILHYSGGTWVNVSPPAVSDDWRLSGVSSPTENEGWAVGYDWVNNKGVILHYSGGTWVNVSPPAVSDDWRLSGVSFPAENRGWAVGHDTANGKGVILEYEVAPVGPIIRANGSDYLTILPGETLNVTAGMDPREYEGLAKDWWIGCLTPWGPYWLNINFDWIPSFTPIRTYGGPIFAFNDYEIFRGLLPEGSYFFFFAIDDNLDGRFDGTYLYPAVVEVLPYYASDAGLGENVSTLSEEEIEHWMNLLNEMIGNR